MNADSTRDPDLLMPGYTYQTVYFTTNPPSSTTKGSHPTPTPGICGQFSMMLLFSGAPGQTNWLELEPFLALLCLFVYDKLSEGKCLNCASLFDQPLVLVCTNGLRGSVFPTGLERQKVCSWPVQSKQPLPSRFPGTPGRWFLKEEINVVRACFLFSCW